MQFVANACNRLKELGEIQFTVQSEVFRGLPVVRIDECLMMSLVEDTQHVNSVEGENGIAQVIHDEAREELPAEQSNSVVAIKDWIVSKPKWRDSFRGHVTSAAEKDSNCLHLWIQRSCDQDDLSTLQSHLSAVTSEALTDPQVGQFCIGLFDGDCYRAEVKAVRPETVRVLFVDYGNEEEGRLEDLQLRALPHLDELYRDALAFECVLFAKDETAFNSESCTKLIEYGEIQFQLESLSVNTSDLPVVSVSTDLIKALSIDSSTELCSTEKSETGIADAKFWQVKRRQLTGAFSGSVCAAVPIADDAEHLRLWVHRACDMSQLKDLETLLETEASSAPDLVQPCVGQTCLVLHNHKWCRAEVMVSNSDFIQLFILDYGDELTGPAEDFNLKTMPSKQELYCESFAFECILACPRKIVSDESAKFAFANQKNLQKTAAISHSENNLQKIDLNNTVDKANNNTIHTDSVVNTGKLIAKKALSGSVSAIVVLAMPKEDGSKRLQLWIQRSSDLANLAEMQNQLEVDSATVSSVTEPHVGQFCIGLYEGGWYRAEVKAVSTDCVRVLFVDYGNEEEGTLEELQLKTLPHREEFYRDAFALECILESTENRCFNSDACDQIVELGEIDFVIKASTESCPQLVIINDELMRSLTCENIDANCMSACADKLVEENSQFETESPSQKKFDNDFVIQKCRQVDSFTGVVSLATPLDDDETKLHLWVQNIRDLDSLATMQSQLEATSSTASSVTEPHVGQFCIGLYEGGWYRAEVKAVSADCVRVLFVDYGNEEEGTLEELQLKTLPHREEFYRDAYVFECILESANKFQSSACDTLVTFGELKFEICKEAFKGIPLISIAFEVLEHLSAEDFSLEQRRSSDNCYGTEFKVTSEPETPLSKALDKENNLCEKSRSKISRLSISETSLSASADETATSNPKSPGVVSNSCLLKSLENWSDAAKADDSPSKKPQLKQPHFKPRLQYTSEQMRAIFARMPANCGCTIWPTPVPPPGRYSVAILPASNPTKLMVHLLPESLQLLPRISERMNFWYNILSFVAKPVSQLYNGKFVAFFIMKSSGGRWYRGLVISINNNDTGSADLLAIDFGFVCTSVLTSFIRELPPDLTGSDWPAAVCLCRLIGDSSGFTGQASKHAIIDVLGSDGACRVLPPADDDIVKN